MLLDSVNRRLLWSFSLQSSNPGRNEEIIVVKDFKGTV